MSRFFASGGQSIGISASASVLPMNIPDWFPLGLTCLISLQSKGLSRIFSNTTVQKHQFFWRLVFLIVQLSHPYMTTGKIIASTRWTFVSKVISLLLNMLSRTDFWTLWEKVRVGCFERKALKHVYYLGWNRSPAQVGCMRQVLGPGALGRSRGIG